MKKAHLRLKFGRYRGPLPSFHQKPEQLTFWLEEAEEVIPDGYAYALHTLKDIKDSMKNCKPGTWLLDPNWKVMKTPFQPTWYYMKTWPYLNKRFTEVI